MEAEKKARRIFTPQQKFEMVQEIEKSPMIKEGCEKFQITPSLFQKWRRQLQVGVNASLRNTKALKSPDQKALERENRRLKEIVLNQSLYICEIKKEMRLD